jgi:hypothetical protein
VGIAEVIYRGGQLSGGDVAHFCLDIPTASDRGSQAAQHLR